LKKFFELKFTPKKEVKVEGKVEQSSGNLSIQLGGRVPETQQNRPRAVILVVDNGESAGDVGSGGFLNRVTTDRIK